MNALNNRFSVTAVFGTRPEAIKMAPVVNALAMERSIDLKVCVSAQHRQMLDQVLEVFEIRPDIDLDLMRPNQSLADITANAIKGLEAAFTKLRPNLVLVHGDTTTTMAASMAAYYQRIPVAHVEAGLRTGDIYSPWPEEVNRRITGAIAELNFAPTEGAKRNLLSENVPPETITVTGNTVVDALYRARQIVHERPGFARELDKKFGLVSEKRLLLVTGHRRENFGKGFERICKAISLLSRRQDIHIIYPVHLNPNVQTPVQKWLKGIDNVSLIEPQDYLPFVYLMSRAHIILTDSGGVQEEAPSLGKPVLVMRDTTERPEALEAGTALLVGTSVDAIVEQTNLLLDDHARYLGMSEAHNPYGDGCAARRIVDKILEFAQAREF